MSHYAIGDVQGCFDELQALLSAIDFQKGKDTLWLAGDIVNRGPQSLPVLQFVYEHQDCVQMVLGNHDLHLLAVAHTDSKQKKGDTLSPILQANNSAILLDFLRQQPLLLQNNNTVMTHAGLYPTWQIDTAVDFAHEVEEALRHPRFISMLREMYGNKPRAMKHDLSPIERIRFAINVFTRMRALDLSHQLDFDYKKSLDDMPGQLHAWFEDTKRVDWAKDIIFGHWSALGLYLNHGKRVYGLDTGAVWAGHLTAMDLCSKDIYQVPSLNGVSLHSVD